MKKGENIRSGLGLPPVKKVLILRIMPSPKGLLTLGTGRMYELQVQTQEQPPQKRFVRNKDFGLLKSYERRSDLGQAC
ncbi:MAG: hypothetical protein ACOX0R_03130 [Candidatus Dojkabacteria bacterium]|jgi:hypothetical protein